MQFTQEQTLAIERRRGELLLDAGAGSGKTSVLVERFARAVHEDGIGVGQILTITFTEKAAAELRERIRNRLRDAGDDADNDNGGDNECARQRGEERNAVAAHQGYREIAAKHGEAAMR